mgnify:CR=1 FL=1
MEHARSLVLLGRADADVLASVQGELPTNRHFPGLGILRDLSSQAAGTSPTDRCRVILSQVLKPWTMGEVTSAHAPGALLGWVRVRIRRALLQGRRWRDHGRPPARIDATATCWAG